MALVIYSNGIIEESVSIENTFSDNELVQSFVDYPEIRTHRLEEIPNCWCIWGHIDDPPANEFNKLASEIVDQDVHSHLIFVHDSEINLNWAITDKILYRSYKEFTESVGLYINEMIQHIATENRQEIEEAGVNPSMIFLTTMGHTQDKRVLFAFNPEEQTENFYADGGWDQFSGKIYEYINEFFYKEPIEENKPFIIFSDSKTIVIIEDKHVDAVIEKLIKTFQNKEKYEICSKISEIKNQWYLRKTLPQITPIDASIGKKPEPPNKKRGRPPKKKDDEEDKKAE